MTSFTQYFRKVNVMLISCKFNLVFILFVKSMTKKTYVLEILLQNLLDLAFVSCLMVDLIFWDNTQCLAS